MLLFDLCNGFGMKGATITQRAIMILSQLLQHIEIVRVMKFVEGLRVLEGGCLLAETLARA